MNIFTFTINITTCTKSFVSVGINVLLQFMHSRQYVQFFYSCILILFKKGLKPDSCLIIKGAFPRGGITASSL